MLEKMKYVLATLCAIVFTPVAMAHSGEHGADGFISALLHQLTAADHWLMWFVVCLFAGVLLFMTRRS